MAASVAPRGDGRLTLGVPQTLFSFSTYTKTMTTNEWAFDANADGSKFLLKARQNRYQERLTVITNWQERLPADRR